MTAQLETESRKAAPVVVHEKLVEEQVRKLRQTLSRGAVSDRKRVLAGVLERVTVGADRVLIEYRLPHPNEPTAESCLPFCLQYGLWEWWTGLEPIPCLSQLLSTSGTDFKPRHRSPWQKRLDLVLQAPDVLLDDDRIRLELKRFA